MCVFVCVRVRVRACVRACVRAQDLALYKYLLFRKERSGGAKEGQCETPVKLYSHS